MNDHFKRIQDSLNDLVQDVENFAKEYLSDIGLEDLFPSLQEEARLYQNTCPPGLLPDLDYINGITNGIVERVSEASNISLEEARERVLRRYLSGK